MILQQPIGSPFLFLILITQLWGSRLHTDASTNNQIVPLISSQHRHKEIKLKSNSKGVYGCCKTIIISCDSALPNCQKDENVSACRDLEVEGLYWEAPWTCDLDHDIFRMVERQNSPGMEIGFGSVYDEDPGYWRVQPESRYCNEFPWVLRSRERNDLCPTNVKEWEVAQKNTTASGIKSSSSRSSSIDASTITSTTPISTPSRDGKSVKDSTDANF